MSERVKNGKIWRVGEEAPKCGRLFCSRVGKLARLETFEVFDVMEKNYKSLR
jgi:hypothetical protein